jgi:8-oxo-dGTP pyrophosphatase MutT (NUDIX family)
VLDDDDDRILLVCFDFGDRRVWAAPCGGVDEDETDEQAVRRELLEETGLDEFDLGPLVWTRTHHVPLGDGRWDGQTERYYLVRTGAFDPVPRLTWAELREENMSAVRWWGLDELETTGMLFAPRRLPSFVRSLLEEGPPASPIDVGV